VAYNCEAIFQSKEEYKELLDAHVEGLSARQQLHYASGRYAMLLIFQGMDSAGKDGAIRHVMSGSTRKVAKSTVSSNQARRSSSTTFSGVPRAASRNAVESVSSTVLIMKKCSYVSPGSLVLTSKPSKTTRAMRSTFGGIGIVPSSN